MVPRPPVPKSLHLMQHLPRPHRQHRWAAHLCRTHRRAGLHVLPLPTGRLRCTGVWAGSPQQQSAVAASKRSESWDFSCCFVRLTLNRVQGIHAGQRMHVAACRTSHACCAASWSPSCHPVCVTVYNCFAASYNEQNLCTHRTALEDIPHRPPPCEFTCSLRPRCQEAACKQSA
jgi:hypothetical protein